MDEARFDALVHALGGAATEVLHVYPDRFQSHWRRGMRAKLGLPDAHDDGLVDDLLQVLSEQRVDWTSCFRMRPPTPVPLRLPRSTLFSAASLRTSGVT